LLLSGFLIIKKANLKDLWINKKCIFRLATLSL
jgi:hypothetical protein